MMGGGKKRPEALDAPLEERLLLPPLSESAVVARSADENGGGGGRTSRKWEKTYLDVLGVCCSAEVALVERLLAPLDGVRAVSVVVPSRTIVVEHNHAAVSQSHIVKALNKAGLDASVRAYGSSGSNSRWPNPYIVSSGVLLLASFFRWLLPPLQWLALAAACAGAPPMLLRGFAAASQLALDINILMLIAVAGVVALKDYMEAGIIVFLFTTAEWLEQQGERWDVVVDEHDPAEGSPHGDGEVVNVHDVGVGTVIAIRAGEVVPIDGVVVDGQSDVDEWSLTGESFLVPK